MKITSLTRINTNIKLNNRDRPPSTVIKIDLTPIFIKFNSIIKKTDFILKDTPGNADEIFLLVTESTLTAITELKTTEDMLPISNSTLDIPYLPFIIENNIEEYYQTPVTSEIHNIIPDNPEVFNLVYTRLLKEPCIIDSKIKTYCVKNFTSLNGRIIVEILGYHTPSKLEELE